MREEREKRLMHELLSSMYNTSCDCRKPYGLPPHLHPEHHSEDCPYRLKIENTDARRIFYEDE